MSRISTALYGSLGDVDRVLEDGDLSNQELCAVAQNLLRRLSYTEDQLGELRQERLLRERETGETYK